MVNDLKKGQKRTYQNCTLVAISISRIRNFSQKRSYIYKFCTSHKHFIQGGSQMVLTLPIQLPYPTMEKFLYPFSMSK
jgi:hypothetical protein